MAGSLPPSKVIMGTVIVAALLAATILVPESRFIIAFVVLFGFGSFLEWLK